MSDKSFALKQTHTEVMFHLKVRQVDTFGQLESLVKPSVQYASHQVLDHLTAFETIYIAFQNRKSQHHAHFTQRLVRGAEVWKWDKIWTFLFSSFFHSSHNYFCHFWKGMPLKRECPKVCTLITIFTIDCIETTKTKSSWREIFAPSGVAVLNCNTHFFSFRCGQTTFCTTYSLFQA